jgi:serine/threonine protein kinase/tetratricopeptide (TPR) repeat protein
MIGKTISHYKILERIGGGGMGVVYKAQDLKLDRFVALKFLPPHLTTSEEEKQRFIHEAKAASTLEHNNICNIHEIDETEDGQLFISMAYYEGETLDKRIKDKPLPIEEAIDIAIQISQGLAKAHEKKIVHRDIKPANIMLTKEGVVKVLDFGLAKLSKQTKLTKEGTTLGTIVYMSPEQTRGEAVDHRTDIWSLGVILYEMITGQLPFKGDYDQAVMYGIANEQPEPITGLRTGVPLDLERIVNRCISKDPQDRYQHADDLLSELNRLKKESELKTIPTQKTISKNRFKSVLLPAAIVSIVMLIIIVYLLIPPDEKSVSGWENSIAVLPFENISADPDQEYFCDGMTEQIISNLSRLARLKVISRTSVMNFKDTDKKIPEIGEELNVAYVLEGSVRKFGDRIRITAQLISTKDDFHVWTENYNKEYKELFDVQDNVSALIATSLLNKLSGEETLAIKSNRPDNIEAYEYFLKAEYLHYVESIEAYDREGVEAGEKHLKTAEKMLQKSIQLDRNFADSYAALANVYNSLYNHLPDTDEDKKKYLELQKAYLDTALYLNPNSAEVYYVMNYLHDAKGEEYLKAEEYNKFEHELDQEFKCLKMALKINANHEKTYAALARKFRRIGLDNLSIKCFNKAIELMPLNNFLYFSRGVEYFRIGEYQKAEIGFQKVLEIVPESRKTLYRYSQLLIALKRFEEAEEILRNIKKIRSDSNTDLYYALIYAYRGQKEMALNTYKDKDASLYSVLGMTEEAISIGNKWSERQLLRKSSQYYFLKNLTFYDNLRSDPRFQEILVKHKELYEENLAKYGDIDI